MDSTCPACGAKAKCQNSERRANSIAMNYECVGCELRFSLQTSANAFSLAQKLAEERGKHE